MAKQTDLNKKEVKHKCDNWKCDFCPSKTCIGCGGVMDIEGNCACAKCQKIQKLEAPKAEDF